MSNEKLISNNPSVRHDYFIEELVEAGLVLTGTEVKSIRTHAPNLKDSYVEVLFKKNGNYEAWITNVHIAPYSHGNIWNHEPLRKRKLLLHKHQIKQLFGCVTQKGMTVVATRMYFKKGIIKIELAIAKGKKRHDKRHALKQKSAEKEMNRAMKSAKRYFKE